VVKGPGSRVQSLGFRVSDFGLRVSGSGVYGGFRVQGFTVWGLA